LTKETEVHLSQGKYNAPWRRILLPKLKAIFSTKGIALQSAVRSDGCLNGRESMKLRCKSSDLSFFTLCKQTLKALMRDFTDFPEYVDIEISSRSSCFVRNE
jgi:hypothetical protein